ncbi:MAG: COX15/CtaA family protein [Terriglobia bacterium]
MGEFPAQSGKKGFARYAWLVLAYDVLVILWGTVVRATGSGAGCGDHWPLCGGQVIPHQAQIATLIEFAHRLTSALAVALVVVLVYLALRRFSKGHAARRYAWAALFFTLTEGLIGAALVLLGDTGQNVSISRVVVLSFHLVNTFLLLASVALAASSASSVNATPSLSPPRDPGAPPRARSRGLIVAYAAGFVGTLALAVTGTIAALADTLFHATSLSQAFGSDFSAGSSPLLRLRLIHPAIAVVVGSYLIVLAFYELMIPSPRRVKRIAAFLGCLVLVQFFLGMLNVLLLTPLPVQLLHLLTADLIWITLVLLAHAVLARQAARATVHLPGAVPAMASQTPV